MWLTRRFRHHNYFHLQLCSSGRIEYCHIATVPRRHPLLLNHRRCGDKRLRYALSFRQRMTMFVNDKRLAPVLGTPMKNHCARPVSNHEAIQPRAHIPCNPRDRSIRTTHYHVRHRNMPSQSSRRISRQSSKFMPLKVFAPYCPPGLPHDTLVVAHRCFGLVRLPSTSPPQHHNSFSSPLLVPAVFVAARPLPA